MHETIQVNPSAQKGSSRAKTGRNTKQTVFQTTRFVNPVTLLKVSVLGTHQTQPN
jgi:hypothetical protein